VEVVSPFTLIKLATLPRELMETGDLFAGFFILEVDKLKEVLRHFGPGALSNIYLIHFY
jgi:hypothetical protein